MSKAPHALHAAERGTQLKFALITEENGNSGVTTAKVPPTKGNPVAIKEGTL